MMLFGVIQFCTFTIFISFICTVPWSTLTPRNLMASCSNVHFSGFRNRLCSWSFARIQFTSLRCYRRCCWSISLGSFTVCIAMSSMYTVSQDSAILRAKTKFIIVWNIAEEFVNLKNMTVGSNKPLFVIKAAFHLSSSLMHTLLYPQSLVKKNLSYSYLFPSYPQNKRNMM